MNNENEDNNGVVVIRRYAPGKQQPGKKKNDAADA
jgi:hypothetical protein